jgi:hypothetical protein
MAHDYRVENSVLVKGELVLVEHGDSLSRAPDNFPPIRFKLTRQNLQKGGFAGTVRPDQAVAVAGGKLDIDVLEDDPLAIGESNVGCGYHGHVLKNKSHKEISRGMDCFVQKKQI